MLVALDLTAAFDTVNITTLFKDLLASAIPSGVKRWLTAYLRGRSTYVEFNGARSNRRKVTQGVPQGGVLSPILFNIYMSKLPDPPANIGVVSYADDISILTTGPMIGPLAQHMNGYLDILARWLRDRHLTLSTAKSSVTLFTTWNREMTLPLGVRIEGHELPLVQQPKLLGVKFDSLHTFAHHAAYCNTKLRQRNNILKKLAGTTWGCSREILLTTYKAIGRSVINYGAPIWTPILSQSRWSDLQRRQNAAMRTISGCYTMTSINHLHSECQLLPVKDHNDLLSRQFYLGAHLPDRPDHHTTTPPAFRTRNL